MPNKPKNNKLRIYSLLFINTTIKMMILFMITWPKSPWAFNREGEKSRSHLATIMLES